MQVVTHVRDYLGFQWWASQYVWSPLCSSDNFLQDGSVFSYDQTGFLGVYDYFTEAGIKVYVRHFRFRRHYVFDDSFGLGFRKPHGRIGTNNNAFSNHVYDVSYNVALLDENFGLLRVNSKR